jgi:hypothetical protein
MTLRTKHTPLTNFTVEWMILLFSICEAPASNLDSLPPGKHHKNTFLVSTITVFNNIPVNQQYNISK